MYTIESRYVSITSKESTRIHQEYGVYQYSYNSPPAPNSKLRLDDKIIEVSAVIFEDDNTVVFADSNMVEHKWVKE